MVFAPILVILSHLELSCGLVRALRFRVLKVVISLGVYRRFAVVQLIFGAECLNLFRVIFLLGQIHLLLREKIAALRDAV